MNMLRTWIELPAATALGWTLFHSLWQGAVAALILAIALAVIRSSRGRYAAACLAMLGMLAGFCFTFAGTMSVLHRAPTGVTTHLLPADQRGAAAPGPVARDTVRRDAADLLPWLAPFWMAGVLVFHIRGVGGWLAAGRLRRRGVCSAPPVWQDRLDRLGARLRVARPVTLLESCLAEVPLVIGHLRPVILMPVGLLAGLPAGQVESILLHELAHIRRYDYLVNLLQTLAEGILFYHPAAWWISRLIRAGREHCCDDLVVETNGDAHEYALALAALEQNRSALAASALAATGGSLIERIRRLLDQPEGPRAALTPVLSAAVLTITAAVALAAWQPTPPTALPPDSPYSKWLNEDVAYIVTAQERTAFLSLHSTEEREHFIEQFWLRRDPTPGTPENEAKQEHYRRIAYANAHFGTAATPGWKTDRGRIYILYGPPDEIESHPTGTQTAYPFEQWLYHHIDAGDNVIIEFVDRTWTADYRMTTDPSGKRAGSTVQILGNSAAIVVPLSGYGDHPLKLYGRLATSANLAVDVFEVGIQFATRFYRKSVEVLPGSYRWTVTVKDVTTGGVAQDTIDFVVK